MPERLHHLVALNCEAAAAHRELKPENVTESVEFIREFGSSPEVVLKALEKYGDAAREEFIREPLGKYGVLSTAVDTIESHLERQPLSEDETQLIHQALRVVGNCCVDHDANRQRVLDLKPTLYPIVGVVQEYNLSPSFPKSLLPTALGALNNLLQDYPPAHKVAKINEVPTVLFKAMGINYAAAALRNPVTEMVLRITEMLIDDEEGLASFPPSAIHQLVSLITKPEEIDFEIFQSALNHINSLLASEKHVNALLETGNLDELLSIFFKGYQLYPPHYVEEEEGGPKKPTYETECLNHLMTTLGERLSEICAQFASLEHLEGHRLGASFVPRLKRWVKEPPLNRKLQQIACLCLGNIARSDAVCIHFVQSFAIHKDLTKIIADETQDIAGIFAAAGFLRNLSLPSQNKIPIGAEPDLWVGLRRMWKANEGLVKDVPYVATSLLRIVSKDCIENFKALLDPVPPGTTSEDYASPTSLPKTNLSHLLHLYQKTDELAIKTEIGRTLISLLRILAGDDHTHTSLQKAMLDRVFNVDQEWDYHETFAIPIVDLVFVEKWEAVRSEGWFALGLLAQLGEGKGALALWRHRDRWLEKTRSILDQFPSGHGIITASGRSTMEGSESPPASVNPKTVSNIAVLLYELSKRLQRNSEVESSDLGQLEQLVDRALTVSTLIQTSHA